MKSQLGNQDDGMIGLGVLALMTIALVASQLGDVPEVETAGAAAPAFESGVVFERVPIEPAAIRELTIVPSFITDADELDWSSDEELLDQYRNAAF